MSVVTFDEKRYGRLLARTLPRPIASEQEYDEMVTLAGKLHPDIRPRKHACSRRSGRSVGRHRHVLFDPPRAAGGCRAGPHRTGTSRSHQVMGGAFH